jgi:hypothetical protein
VIKSRIRNVLFVVFICSISHFLAHSFPNSNCLIPTENFLYQTAFNSKARAIDTHSLEYKKAPGTRLSEIYLAHTPGGRLVGFVKVPKRNIFQRVADFDFLRLRKIFPSTNAYIDQSVAFYEVAQSLGLDIVPLTKAIDLSDGTRALYQAFVEGVRPKDLGKIEPEHLPHFRKSIQALALLDIIALSQDRHLGNLLLESDRHLWVIDNDRSFPLHEKAHWRWSLPWETTLSLAKGPLESSLRDKLLSHQLSNLTQILQKNNLSPRAIELAEARYLKMKDFLISGGNIEDAYAIFFSR